MYKLIAVLNTMLLKSYVLEMNFVCFRRKQTIRGLCSRGHVKWIYFAWSIICYYFH